MSNLNLYGYNSKKIGATYLKVILGLTRNDQVGASFKMMENWT